MRNDEACAAFDYLLHDNNIGAAKSSTTVVCPSPSGVVLRRRRIECLRVRLLDAGDFSSGSGGFGQTVYGGSGLTGKTKRTMVLATYRGIAAWARIERTEFASSRGARSF